MHRYSEAINSFNKALKIDSQCAEAYKGLSSVYCGKEKYDDALEASNQAVKFAPRDAEAFNGLGSVYCLMKRYNEAIAAFKKAIAIDKNYTVAIDNLKLAEEAAAKGKR